MQVESRAPWFGSAPPLVTFSVRGVPIEQGNHRTDLASGRIYDRRGAELAAWRDAVAVLCGAAIRRARLPRPLLEAGQPAAVGLLFVMRRPHTVARPLPAVRPDLDKLERALLDALTAGGAYGDDGQVCDLWGAKRYGDAWTGVVVAVGLAGR